MRRLHLGVIEQPYVNAPAPGQKKATSSTVTTGDVAGWLEDDYGIMQHFFDANDQKIADALAASVAGSLENLLMGAPPSQNVFGAAESKIQHMFHRFIQTAQMDKLGVPGVPTQAAKDRASGAKRSTRMKNRKKGGNTQPISFYDTGLYMDSFVAWIE